MMARMARCSPCDALTSPPPEHIIDDMYVSLMVLCSGYRVVQAQ